VIYINGRPTGRWNFINNIQNAKGKYIALLDGDDYWTDSKKLQIQVDFLEKNEDFAICAHNVNVTYMNSDIAPHPFYKKDPAGPHMRKKPESVTEIDDLIAGNYLQTPSVVFRAGLFRGFPDWYCKLDRGDWPLHILNAQHGKIMYIDKIMATYLVHDDGIYSCRTRAEQLEGAANVAITLDNHLLHKYHNTVFIKNTERFLSLILIHYRSGNYIKACKIFLKYIKIYRFMCIPAVLKLICNHFVSDEKQINLKYFS
jgi:hypothetical protein